MGLIQFAKDVGKKLGIDLNAHPQQQQKPQAQPQAATPAAQPAAAPQSSPADQDRQKGAALFQLLQQMGLHGDDLGVRVDGDKVTLTGKVPSQEVREKMVLLVGNHQGIASVDDQLQVAQQQSQEPAATFYDVKPGDTLSKIAKQLYGDANKYHQIFEANRPMLKDPDEIYPGQKLRIPAQAAVGAHA